MAGSEKASATLQRQFESLQEQQAQKLARRKQRSEERGKLTTSRSDRSQLSTAASRAFGIDDDLGLQLAPETAQPSALEEHQSLKEQVRELKDETGRLYKLLSERDLEVRQLRKKNEQQKAVLATAGSGTNETAALKIVELSKKVRDLTAEAESERTRSKQWARKCMDLENEKQKNDLNSSGRNHGNNSSRPQQYSDADIKSSLEADLKALQHKFSQSEQKCAEQRNMIHEVKQELKLTQKVLANEVGEGVTVQSLLNAPSGWRGRAQQVLALQKKVTELKGQVQNGSIMEGSTMGDDLERELLGSTTSRRPTANDLHREQIRRMDRERKEAQERMVNELRALEQDQEAMKNKLDASKARNKVLSGEIKSLKAQLATLLEKGKHDDELISALMKQQTQLQNLLSNSTTQDKSEKADYDKKVKDLHQKGQHDVNTITQLQTIVTEKEARVTQLEEQLTSLRQANLQRAQAEGVNALFERAASRAGSCIPPSDDGALLSSPTPPPASRMSDRAPSAQSERPGSRKQTGQDHPTNSSGDPGVPVISAADLQELHAQVQQHRSLCQAAEVERDRLAELVKVLQSRLGESTQTAADAQQEVQAQKRRHVMLEKQLGKVKVEQSTGRTSGKRSSRVRGSAATLHELIDEEAETAGNTEELQTRLEIQQDENSALKAALQSTLAAKEDDLRVYHEILDQTKAIFLQGLRQFRAQ